MKTNPILGKLLAEFLDLNGLCNKTNDPSGRVAQMQTIARDIASILREMGNPSAEAFSSFGDNARLRIYSAAADPLGRPDMEPNQSPVIRAARLLARRHPMQNTQAKAGPGRKEVSPKSIEERRAFFDAWQEASQERGETFDEFWPTYKLPNGKSPNRQTAHKWRNYVSKKKAAGLWA